MKVGHLDARAWPFEVPNPILVMGACLLPKAMFEGVHILEAFGPYARLYGLNSCTCDDPFRVVLSIDDDQCIDEEVDYLVGDRIYCFRHPVLVHQYSKVTCEFSSKELDDILVPMFFFRTALSLVEDT